MERLNHIQRRHNRLDKCECDGCTGRLTVQCTVIDHDRNERVQYLYCNKCPWHPEENKLRVPLEFSPPRNSPE